MLNEFQAAELVRRELNLPEGANLRIIPLIGRALELVANKIANNSLRRHLLLTPKTVTLSLDGDGKAALNAIDSNFKILSEKIEFGVIRHADKPFPLQFIREQRLSPLKRASRGDFYYFWMDGADLQTKNFADENAITGDITLQIPFIPKLSQLPAELEQEFISNLCDVCAGIAKDYRADAKKK